MNRFFFIPLLLVGIGAAEVLAAFEADPLSRLLKGEPSFSEIVRVALREENLGFARIDDWKRKMKIAPWFPTLAVGYDRTIRETNGLSITDNISVTSSAVTVGPEGSDLDQTINQGDVLKIRAAWSLADLFFHPSVLQASREGRDLTQSRLSLTDSLFKLHSERRLLIRAWSRQGKRNTKARGLCDSIGLLTEKLDSLTADLFAERWWSCNSQR